MSKDFKSDNKDINITKKNIELLNKKIELSIQKNLKERLQGLNSNSINKINANLTNSLEIEEIEL